MIRLMPKWNPRPRRGTSGRWLVLLVMLYPAHAQDPGCPAYPVSNRIDAARSIQLDREYAIRGHSHTAGAAVTTPPSKNVIDDWIFQKMVADGVDPAPLTSDSEFIRRIYLDLTGRIPTFEQTKAFIADTSPDKRDKLVDTLLASSAYVDQFSFWFRKRFQVVRATLDNGVFISVPEPSHVTRRYS